VCVCVQIITFKLMTLGVAIWHSGLT